MKETIKLFPFEMDLVKVAMKVYRQTLSDWNQRQFDIAYYKVLNSNKGIIKLDGMEMEFVLRALRSRGWDYYKADNRVKAFVYFDLAQWMKERKMQYQEKNGPKITKAVSA